MLGRQHQRMDKIELRNILWIAEDREEWKAVVRRFSTAPRRIPNLRDRIVSHFDSETLHLPYASDTKTGRRHHAGRKKVKQLSHHLD
ncbi:hypothetical protein ElyMa_005036200 [Elysia marginata]|uniref:Uncharacterized protein n=1 Tax=Elysia marginata TaxID=1093978 RepID=A0AAV4JF25_9GAST|nr:hypothetical protein ElyMa_005036200 [Elysia marginata]